MRVVSLEMIRPNREGPSVTSDRMEQIEKDEFEQLVRELEPLDFSSSKDLTSHILQNKLGTRFPHISGILEMEKDGRTYNFRGGFPPHIFAKLCQRLRLARDTSSASATNFQSFQSLGKNKNQM